MIAKVNTLTKKITFTAGPYPNASGDDLVQKLDFVIDRFTGNGVDLGESDIYIYYTNGRGDTYSHPILSSSITRDDLFLRFRWDFAKEVSEVSGTTLFSICAKKESNGKYITEWNSEKASLPVIKSIGNREVKDFDSTSYQEVEGMLAESESKVNGKIAMFSTEITEKMAEFESDVDEKVYAAEQYKELSSNYRYLSESYAKGTMNDEPTPYGDAGYHDNSKYYKGFAEAYAKGTIDGTAVTSGQPGYQDNAKYYKEQVEASANQIAINTARIDQIESLPGGSTSLDAEVVDIRVKADGQSATTAGNAVREQVTELRNLVTETTYNATLWAQGTPPASTNTTFIMTSDPINGKYVGAVVPSGKYVLLFAKNGSTKVGYYRAANDTFVGSVASATQYTEGSPIFEEIFAAYPTYTWYFVARFTAEGAISPSDGATVGLISNRIDIIDNQLEEHDDEIDDLKNALTSELDYLILTPILNTGSYVNTTGGLSTGANYCYTDPIAIAKGEQVQLIVGGGMTGNVACIFSCNQDGTNRAMLVRGSADTEYSYLAPEDGYVGFSFNVTYTHEMKKYGISALPVLTTKVDDLKNHLTSELDYLILTPILNTGSYVNTTGGLSTGANHCYTDPIAIAKGEQVQLIVGGGMTGNVACIFSCNQDGTNRAMLVRGSADTEYSYLAPEDGYVGFSFNVTYTHEMKKYGISALPVLTTKVDDLTTEVDFTNSALQKTLIAPDAKASGYRLYSSGLSVANNIFELRKYAVTAGEKILVMTDTPPADGAVYIFNVGSNASSSSTANIVSVQVTPVNGEIIVPERATYLIISALKIDTTSGVYRYNVLSDSDIVALNIGFKAKANQGLAKINKAADASTLPPILSLLHFSDIHGNSTNLSRIVEFKNAYRNLIKDAICTGDMTVNVFSDGMTFWNNVDGAEKIMMCIGNHDVAVVTDYSHYGVTVEQAYNQFFAPYIANWNCVYESGKTYWYKDYATEKIRLIALDYLLTGDDATAQNTWLATALSGAKTNGYAVVGIEHTPPTTRTKINTTFTSLLNDYGGTFGSPYMQTVQDFIDGGGVFLCWLGGHTHVDYVEYNPNYPAQPFIIVTSAKGATGYEDGNRIVGDRSQDAFNVVFLDAGSKLVKLVRVGQDRDAQLRHIDTLTLDVSTSPATVVWND